MKKFLNTLKEIGLYIWQLPQNLLGLCFVLFCKDREPVRVENGNLVYVSKRMNGGISLGKYSIISSLFFNSRTTKEQFHSSEVVRHEAFGHGTQSRILGPLYLIVIGLPSIIWAWLYGTVIPCTKNGYYRFYTESTADKLGGVIRK